MKKYKRITTALVTATCGLIGTNPACAVASENTDIGSWDISSAILFYSESDRVSAIEPIIKGRKQLDSDEYLTLKLTFDSLTGASASGAVPTDRAQTFTRPSGTGSYVINANEIPLDDTFHDTRVALNTTWEKPLSRMVRMTLGGNFSKEYDYTSISANTLFSFDTNQKNTTWMTGISLAADSIEPEGGLPKAFGQMAVAGSAQPRIGQSDDKTITDLLFGVTQVVDKNSLFQFNYSFSQSDGYLSDPFKVLSVIGMDGRPVNIGSGYSQAVYENRPDSRIKHSVFGQYKRYIEGDVFDISYRYLWDDWDLKSHTIDAHYRFSLSDTSYLQPHIRYYQQSAVEFYRPFILASSVPAAGDVNTYATADYRLGDMTAYTVGLEYGKTNGRPWSLSAEYYMQSIDEPNGKFGELNNQELSPDVDAIMLRVNYDF